MEKKVMSNDASNCPAVAVLNSPSEDVRAQMRDLRRQILDLRNQLRDARRLALQNDLMQREGDHRIKNSLQLVASLMRLQVKPESSAPVRDALRAAAARISGVAVIHDALHISQRKGMVDLGETLRQLCASLHAMAGDKDRIEVVVAAEDFQIPAAMAQCVVLAVNELVSNALRHAFLERDRGAVSVTLRRTHAGMMICVADDGTGFPLHRAATQGYGTALVQMMVQQLGGTLMMETQSGACFTILAPLAYMPECAGARQLAV